MTAGTSGTSVTVVVVTWQGRHLLGACLESLTAQTLPHRLVVVDNASTDGTADFLAAEHPEATVVIDAGEPRLRRRRPGRPRRRRDAVRGAAQQRRRGRAGLARRPRRAPRGAPRGRGRHLPHGAGRPARRPEQHRRRCCCRSGYGTDRGFGEPDGAYAEAGGGVRVQRRRGRCCAWPPSGRSAGSRAGSSSTTRTPTSPGGCGWPAGRSATSPAPVVRHQHSATVDQQSESFAFHNERNRLLTLLRCAPAGAALRGRGAASC